MRRDDELREFHAAKWDEPIVMELGRPGARGQVFAPPEDKVTSAVGEVAALIPAGMARKDRPELPELTEFEAQRHYLHLSQQVLGMMGISLFGTCTMKYNSRMVEHIDQPARTGREPSASSTRILCRGQWRSSMIST